MQRFLVAYDLRKPDRDYQPLYDELESLGASRIQESVWVLRADDDQTAEGICAKLFAHADSDKDRMLVVGITGFSSRNGIKKIKDV